MSNKLFFGAIALWLISMAMLVIERWSVLRLFVPLFAVLLTVIVAIEAYVTWRKAKEARRTKEIQEFLKGDIRED